MSEVYELDGVILPVEPAAAPQQPESKARSDNAVTERPTLPTEVLQKPARQSYELPAAAAEEELQRARPADSTPGKLSAPRPAATLQQDTAERTPAATAFTAELKSPTDPTPACDATARQSAAAWRACIEELRDAGLLQAATSEYEAFALEYPKIAAEFRPDK